MGVRSPLEFLKSELDATGVGLMENSDLLRGILSGCGDCIKILDLDGRLQFMSEGGKRVMEVEDFSSLKGCIWPSFWDGDGRAQALAAVETAKAGGVGRFRGPANTAKGTPKYWDVQVSPILDDENRPSHLLSISRDITEEWQAAERLQFLTDELQHRVKNTLTTVMAIANQTFRDVAHRDSLQTFSTRVTTLNRVHDALTEGRWGDTPVRRVVEDALAPYRIDDHRFSLSGRDIDLAPKEALAMALAVNELATNALKYGALSAPAGSVEIVWSREAAAGTAPLFRFVWQERGGPPVREPERKGFGTRVIGRLLADDFGGSVELSFEPSGLRCCLTAPVRV